MGEENDHGEVLCCAADDEELEDAGVGQVEEGTGIGKNYIDFGIRVNEDKRQNQEKMQ